VASVQPGGLSLFIATVNIDRPSVSDSRYELLALVVALLAGGCEEFDALHPFGLGQLHLACKRVQVLHQAGHDLLQTRIGRLREARHHRLRDVVLIEVAHGLSPLVLPAGFSL